MRYAIPVDVDGSRFDHFGFCDHFVVVEVTESDGAPAATVAEGGGASAATVAEIPNPVKGPKGGEGRVSAFRENGVEAVVTDHVGAPMFEKLTAAGMPIYLERELLAPEDAALKAFAGALPQMTAEDL